MGYGIATISKKNDAQQVCSTQVVCATQDGVDKWNDADHNGTMSTFAFVVGALGLLEAAVLWWLPTGHDASSTQLGPRARWPAREGDVVRRGLAAVVLAVLTLSACNEILGVNDACAGGGRGARRRRALHRRGPGRRGRFGNADDDWGRIVRTR